jgi:galactose mutarotase-like enzyme
MVDLVRLAAGGASAVVAAEGGELRSWRPAGAPELLWHGDPAHWPFWAPILFPIVGHLRDDRYRWRGRSYAMVRHGFTRFLQFRCEQTGPEAARFVLVDDAATRRAYPFAFRLPVDYALGVDTLDVGLAVENRGDEPMPYGAGFHPAFHWPFAGGTKNAYRVELEREEAPTVPELTATGLICRTTRPSPLVGRRLDLRPELFSGGAFVFAEARSREMAFVAGDGSAIVMTVGDFPHLAIWTKPTAPFLSLEAWTSFSDAEDGDGELERKPSMIRLPPGETRRHGVRLAWRDAGRRGSLARSPPADGHP